MTTTNDMNGDIGVRSLAMGRIVILALMALPVWGLAAIVAVPLLSMGLFAAGLIAVIVAAFLALQHVRARPRVQAVLRVAEQVIAHDNAMALIADRSGRVIAANHEARVRLEKADDDTVETRLSALIAHPAPVIFRLKSQAETSGSSSEDVATQSENYYLSVTRVAQDIFIWRCEGVSHTDVAQQYPVIRNSLPVVTVNASGDITHLNDSFRSLLRSPAAHIRDVFRVEAVIPGMSYVIDGPQGSASYIIAEVAGENGLRDIYAFCVPIVEDTVRPIVTSWDAIEDLPVPLLQIAADGMVLASNREARGLLGIQSTDGKQIGDILDGLGRPMRDWLRDALAGQPGQASQFLRGRGDFHDTFVQVTLNIAGAGGKRHFVAVLNDVTELKTLEAQFVQSQKMHAIGQLAGGVAHDFNNLLTAISGHCDLLLLRHDQADQDYGDLIQIHQNANRAASLVGQLLAFSRKQNLQPEIIDLRDALSDLAHLLNRLVGEKIKLSVHHHPELATIKADKRQLEQVMMNLVVNARDAMPEGGTIRVTTENRVLTAPLDRDRASVPPGEYVLVTVSDHGTGIPPEIMRQIFEPFVSTKRQGEGTGLGLSTAYGIVKQSGGFIFAESTVGVGTDFVLMFPQCAVPEVASRPVVDTLPKPMVDHVDGVVLLVEDEAPVRAFASRALRLRGYTVLEADSAEAALSLLDDPELNVDVFVTDVIMPGMDGPTWVRQALTQRPDTKVIFVSGYAEDAFTDGNPQIPNSVFLPKPFSLNDLTNTVQQQLH